MTFVAGFNSANGLCLCADSLEQDGYVKRKVDKLRTHYPTNDWGICGGGAGPASLIKSFWDKYIDALGNDPLDLASFERKTEACLKAMYKKFPEERLSFVIGVFSNAEPFTERLFLTMVFV